MQSKTLCKHKCIYLDGLFSPQIQANSHKMVKRKCILQPCKSRLFKQVNISGNLMTEWVIHQDITITSTNPVWIDDNVFSSQHWPDFGEGGHLDATIGWNDAIPSCITIITWFDSYWDLFWIKSFTNCLILFRCIWYRMSSTWSNWIHFESCI